ncbi:pyruvate kinase [Sulfuricurvum sp. RIFCSPLOWO2_12_FULL_43_24]|uniref:pyruvate kinase n=1 Tax=Sulfuricurvum sp. RIFCSPLOWO2_12_FULL_43_24 TaxID=1802247 RepID=UPI0008BBDEA4|nr:pyruvate kinase [Sulfuricurvum sp. RIFCSPLOWO2_12_FULL_43_24]OHD84984.1 MAG: pyruvate kinase [Sulfuricurvum sp. RIFCSPHIGHO2_02_FULL_43_9]OHD85356.1 MAG: pyruvate kinase [Sulfuricurvum sp. RIFCSPLOWO2_02_FULL_43_45]OHD87137.1 MAG: pyruvate kinase [Sulfuricurvum sp. RIFCSPLOWO2_12_43_5]OHD88686.1 MAG: pyruvate kinase [Sulfuricurvum sp. RIFCSPLOWO2_12_FULL_43_24]
MEKKLLAEIFEKLLDLNEKMRLGINPKKNNPSLLNMHHYLNLRKYDFAHLQDDLTKVGLSSFGRSQAHIEASVNVALEILSRALGKKLPIQAAHLSYEASHQIMDKNAQIFSTSSDKTKIMITVPSEFDENWFSDLSHEGVHLFRINTAHDNPAAWNEMAKGIKKASCEDKDLKIYVDLAGPKIRTSLEKIKKSEKPKKIKVFYGNKVLIHSTGSSLTEKKSKHYDAVVGCSLSKIGSMVNVGDPLFLDDGKIQLIIDEILGEDIICTVLTRNDEGSKIKDEKGINFPNSDIAIHAICDYDREVLPHIVEYADIIGISFTQTPEDVTDLIQELEHLGKKGHIAIVAKIETKKGVQNLPAILETLIQYGNSGIMIARGDLAIEIGFENLAYMQEEILDLCTAAHIPVILATQVLESKMKTNIPSRAEISDVAFAHKAECVMLNKGDYALETIKILTTIFAQMDLIFRKNKLLYNPSFQWK